jgi:hypothetical protein
MKSSCSKAPRMRWTVVRGRPERATSSLNVSPPEESAASSRRIVAARASTWTPLRCSLSSSRSVSITVPLHPHGPRPHPGATPAERRGPGGRPRRHALARRSALAALRRGRCVAPARLYAVPARRDRDTSSVAGFRVLPVGRFQQQRAPHREQVNVPALPTKPQMPRGAFAAMITAITLSRSMYEVPYWLRSAAARSR